jgi:hypothetical protein
MHKLIWILGCLLMVFSCAHRAQPIYNAEISVPTAVSIENIQKSIQSALIKQGWTIQKEDNELIESKILVRSHSAGIRIPYNKDLVRVQYVSSNNYLYSVDEGTQYIHRNYNRLISLLERDISHNLSLLQ